MVAEDSRSIPVALPSGEVVVTALIGVPMVSRAVVIVAHGAGTAVRHPFLSGLTEALRDEGFATVRFNFPYAEAGRRMPGPAAHAIATWSAVMAVAAGLDAGPVWATGRSYGGRMASMAAADGSIDPAGLVYLGYPLHPPGKPDAPRIAHLPSVAAPQLFVSGRTDPFIDPHEQLIAAVATCRDAVIRWVDGDHSFVVRGRRQAADAIGAGIAPIVAGFVAERSGV